MSELPSTDPAAVLLAVAGASVPPKLVPPLAGPLRGVDIAQFVALRAAACVSADYSNLALVQVGSPNTIRLFHGAFLDSEAAARYADLEIDAGFPITEAIRTRETIVLDSEAAYRESFPAIWDETAALGVHATISMPLFRADGSAIGALGFAWSDPPSFDVKLDKAMTALAHLVTEIVQRAEVYEAEHQMIADLHRRLLGDLPSSDRLVTAARYLPAGHSTAIGGDWYEGVLLDDGAVAIVVGDVVGHGLAAAADMALIRGMVTALLHDGVPVADVFSRVSHVLHRRPEDLLATAALVVIEPGRDQITYCTAGHPPPLLVGTDGSVVPLDQANTPILGIRHRRSASATMPFPPGSTLVMYTDGLVETRGRSFDEGIRALTRMLTDLGPSSTPAQLVDRALADLVLDETANDDIAIVVVEHRAPSPG